MLGSIIELPPAQQIYRAAWNKASIWPHQVERTYRFGPPAETACGALRWPFHWVYLGSTIMTAVWEAQFCANDVTRPGTFYIRPGAASGLIARMRFRVPLRLIDLTGATASKLGIFDALASPEHAWCQWFGCQIDQLILEHHAKIDGIRYMSRKLPGQFAYALSSRAMARLDGARATAEAPFFMTAEFEALQTDPCCVPAP